MSKIEDYRFTNLEARKRVPFRNSIPSPENGGMAVEKFIHGKHDDAKHEGKRAELRRMASADQSLKDWRSGEMTEGQEVIFPIETAQPAPIYPMEMFRQMKQNTIDIPDIPA